MTTRPSRRLPLSPTLIALALMGACTPASEESPTPEAESPSQQGASERHYLFSYFTGNGETGLHLAYSQDGLQWRALNDGQPLLAPDVGEARLMRDPSIVRGSDGTFHMVWTAGWTERGIGYANSPDLLNWSPQQYLTVMEHEPTARNTWAPDAFFDEATGRFLVVWATTIPGRFPDGDGQDARGEDPGWNHRLYYVATEDFETFSEPSVFYDQGFNVIDGTILENGERYAMVLKDERNEPFEPQKNLRLAFSDQAEGPWSEPTEPITGEYWAEGPTAIEIDGRWHVYFDKYIEDAFGVVVSEDLETWTDLSDQLVMPEGMHHGTVFEVPGEVAEALPGV